MKKALALMIPPLATRPAMSSLLAAIFLLASLLTIPGCGSRESSSDAPAVTYASPDEAVTALISAVEARDRAKTKEILGFRSDTLLTSGDAVEDSTQIAAFVSRYHEKHQLATGSPDELVLQVGADDWPFPIPLLRDKNNRWHFDGVAGADEIAYRRIGANELRTIAVMHGYVEAQRDYAAKPHDGIPAGAYAQMLRSDPGKQNGLYWDAAPGQPESPAGPFLASATAEGYGGQGAGAPYHGYLFRPLDQQGAAAASGARPYVVDGRQTGGFALLAWPASYGASGVMSFMVNQDGVVWQRDLGAQTPDVAASIKQFDPDSTWTPIPPEE